MSLLFRFHQWLLICLNKSQVFNLQRLIKTYVIYLLLPVPYLSDSTIYFSPLVIPVQPQLASFYSSNMLSKLLPQGLCAYCILHLEQFLPRFYSSIFFLSFLKCILLSEYFLVLLPPCLPPTLTF